MRWLMREILLLKEKSPNQVTSLGCSFLIMMNLVLLVLLMTITMMGMGVTVVKAQAMNLYFFTDNGMQPASSRFHNFGDYWDEDTVKQLDDSVSVIQNMRSMQSPRMQFESLQESSIPSKALFFKHVFISTAVEKAVHQYVVSNIPAPYPTRSPRIIKMLKVHWVDHRTFGLSMQVFGSVSAHVMNIMGVAVMEEQFRKHFSDSLPSSTWCKHILSNSVSLELQNVDLVPSNISYHFSERYVGYSLDNADLEHAKPIREALTYYLCTHEENQFLLPAIRDIAEQHGIKLSNYT